MVMISMLIFTRVMQTANMALNVHMPDLEWREE